VSQSLLERVRQIVADIFNLPQSRIEPSSSPDTIEGWDSLQHLNLTLALEQEFGVQFTPEEIEQLLSVELIADLLDEKLATSL
jgi:acyl carrier protein